MARKMLDFLNRFSRLSRVIAAVLMFITAVMATLVALAIASKTGDDAWVLHAVLVNIGFAVLVTPVVVSLHNQSLEADGIYGMYTSQLPANGPMPKGGLFDRHFNRWFIGK